MNRIHRVFLDTSVIIAAVFSEKGGARKLFRLGEVEVIQLVVGPSVLRECEEVVRRKIPASLPNLAYLLELVKLEVVSAAKDKIVDKARTIVEYQPDAYVLAEAIEAAPEWFVTHDKEHFLSIQEDSGLSFRVGTPGDLIQALEEELSQEAD